MSDNKQHDNEKKEDWLGKLVFWLAIGAVVFGITTFLGYINDRAVFSGDDTFYVELTILVSIVMLATLDGLFGKK